MNLQKIPATSDLNFKKKIQHIENESQFGNMIARSKSMLNIFTLSTKVAQFDTTVLITGESGTGKELIARGIHFNSKRAKMPFIPENCGCVPENLLESDLFGHERGAFTGAVRKYRII